MKMRNKGKVHPTPSSSSPSSTTHISSILKLLPAAILALATVLSLEDKEVLAYMITRSIKTTNPSSILEEKTKRNSKKIIVTHNPPKFDCECFDCYTSYWFKWDSSLNRELIHHAIEAFEEHLNNNNGEVSAGKKGRNKKRDQKGRRGAEKFEEISIRLPEPEKSIGSPENELESPVMVKLGLEDGWEEVVKVEGEVGLEMVVVEPPEIEVVARSSPTATAGGSHKGLARKVLPDVLGLFNSRLWSLWSPNV